MLQNKMIKKEYIVIYMYQHKLGLLLIKMNYFIFQLGKICGINIITLEGMDLILQ